ncbi:selenide, water dikinase SelD [Profundibacterium mesophilum]|uniref:Selenide water dikinase n=1 Tax=Profundibacterium mesophilum KAUST100406-0324 TaxID=1037889 RepID=A0A921NZM5_9RHOB|nr:selenide, water dikinase SelD [Profundibacterium mesophilum]KAF0677574.1 Selenide water dikinase [Profundibacterium mesophilum KAUST100406-0324]
MRSAPLPLTRDLVLVGGGHAHALVLRAWGMDPLPGARLTIINPEPAAPYTGMLPGHVAGHYARDMLDIDLVKLARFAGARLILGKVDRIDRAAREIGIGGRVIGYDVASLDIGIHSRMPDMPGFSEHAVAAKPLDRYADRWEAHLRALGRGTAPDGIAVIGGGVGGVELAMAMAHGARRASGRPAEVTVIDAGDALSAIGRGARAALHGAMTRLGVRLIEGAGITRIEERSVLLDDGRRIKAGFVVGAAGARPHDWLCGTGLALERGFVRVGPTLQSSDPSIFAAGDCAHLDHAPRPKAGVFAVRQAPILHRNLKIALGGSGRLRRYRPQRDYLKLISQGSRSAVADKWGMRLEGWMLWRWKDRIDRRFMERLSDLPLMPPPRPPRDAADGLVELLGDGQMPCGGCGAKVGMSGLTAALGALPVPMRPDVEKGAGDDAAVLDLGGMRQVITTDQLRPFTEDPWLMARITTLHALGDIWAMGAAPQAALLTLTLPRLGRRLEARMLAEIMDAAGSTLSQAGAEIVGGHTATGPELSIGLTLTGLAGQAPIRIGGAEPGDALILTRPIGSGVILAAEMAGSAPGRAVAAALCEMARTQGPAARILRGAHAMTDVTGFGLAGHLLAMMEASATAARLNLSAVPLMEGARALAQTGTASTLAPENLSHYAGRVSADERIEAALLFDPQTAGGLLAAVPRAQADALLAELAQAGFRAAVIGEVTRGAPFVELI